MSDGFGGRVLGEVATGIGLATAICGVLAVVAIAIFDRVTRHHANAAAAALLVAIAVVALVGLTFAVMGLQGFRKRPFPDRGLVAAWRFWTGVVLIVVALIGAVTLVVIP